MRLCSRVTTGAALFRLWASFGFWISNLGFWIEHCKFTSARRNRQLSTGNIFFVRPALLRHHARVNFREKIISWSQLPAWRAAWHASGRRLVVTNGCFDILHAGHVTYLQAARNLGDALLVGITNDLQVGALKGPGRPVNCEADRATLLAALESVSGVCIFTERTAEHFLAIAQPDIYAKGGDYTIDTINQAERHLIERAGGKVMILPVVPGCSTTSLLAKIAKL